MTAFDKIALTLTVIGMFVFLGFVKLFEIV